MGNEESPIYRAKRSVYISVGWRSGAVVRASDFGPRGPWFDSRPVHISLWP